MSKNEKFPRLFSTVNLRGHSLRNRIVFGAHTTNMSENGLPGERHLAYYRERAMGGAAKLVIELISSRTSVFISLYPFGSSTQNIYRKPDQCHASTSWH